MPLKVWTANEVFWDKARSGSTRALMNPDFTGQQGLQDFYLFFALVCYAITNDVATSFVSLSKPLLLVKITF